MGYENLDNSSTRYSIAAHVHEPATNTNIIVDPDPLMFDGETLKIGPALAKKSLAKMDGDSRIIVADENQC